MTRRARGQPSSRREDGHEGVMEPWWPKAKLGHSTMVSMTTTLTLRLGRDQRGGFAAIRLHAHHVTLPDRSRGATDSGLFKYEQSSKGFGVIGSYSLLIHA